MHVGIQHILCDQMSECECAFEVSEKEKRGERERFRQRKWKRERERAREGASEREGICGDSANLVRTNVRMCAHL